MEDYNQQDAKSVLEYIYRNYGKTVFQEKGKVEQGSEYVEGLGRNRCIARSVLGKF